MNEAARCSWANGDPLMAAYHDEEWGKPERDSRALWEKLMLDGFQAGLSWITILRKRDTMREAFEGFVPETIAAYTEADVERLLLNPGIIRSRAKIVATIGNAQAYLKMAEGGEEFSEFIWSFVPDGPVRNAPQTTRDIPADSPLSQEMSKALKKRGFKFVGPVIVNAFLQAVGVVNDHVVDCPWREPRG